MKPYGKSYDEFENEKLAMPGTLVKIAADGLHFDGGIFLIGDVNANRGLCDDCPMFSSHQIVEAYDDSLVAVVLEVKIQAGS